MAIYCLVKFEISCGDLVHYVRAPFNRQPLRFIIQIANNLKSYHLLAGIVYQ